MTGKDLLDHMEHIDPELIEAADRAPAARKRAWGGWLAAAACLAVAVLAAALWRAPWGAAPTPSGTPAVLCYVTMDVNPAIRLTVADGKVTESTALNGEAEALLAGLELSGRPVEEAIPAVLDAVIDLGYLTGEETPVVLLSAYGDGDEDALLELAADATAEALSARQDGTFVISQKIDDLGAVEPLAKEYGVSVGKMQYLLNLSLEDATLEQASEQSLSQLFSMDAAQRLEEPVYPAEDYDENGEKVLYVKKSEILTNIIPWSTLSKNARARLDTLYTPEDLALLLQPSRTVTAPNAVGLTEAEARKQMNSSGIAVRVLYTSGGQGQQTYAEGTCIRQSVAEGASVSTSTPVTLWVLAPVSPPTTEDPGKLPAGGLITLEEASMMGLPEAKSALEGKTIAEIQAQWGEPSRIQEQDNEYQYVFPDGTRVINLFCDDGGTVIKVTFEFLNVLHPANPVVDK